MSQTQFYSCQVCPPLLISNLHFSFSLPPKQVQPLAGAAAKFPTRVQPYLRLLEAGRQRPSKGGFLKTKVRGGATRVQGRILSARAKVSLRDHYRPFAPTFPAECWCRAARGSVCLLGSTAASAPISQAHTQKEHAPQWQNSEGGFSKHGHTPTHPIVHRHCTEHAGYQPPDKLARMQGPASSRHGMGWVCILVLLAGHAQVRFMCAKVNSGAKISHLPHFAPSHFLTLLFRRPPWNDIPPSPFLPPFPPFFPFLEGRTMPAVS